MPISADLGPKLEKVVEDLVGNGRFNSKSEVLREGVRLVEEREKKLAYLDRMIEEGIKSAETGPLLDPDEVFERLKQKFVEKAEG